MKPLNHLPPAVELHLQGIKSRSSMDFIPTRRAKDADAYAVRQRYLNEQGMVARDVIMVNVGADRSLPLVQEERPNETPRVGLYGGAQQPYNGGPAYPVDHVANGDSATARRRVRDHQRPVLGPAGFQSAGPDDNGVYDTGGRELKVLDYPAWRANSGR